jgi:hypothetical protein
MLIIRISELSGVLHGMEIDVNLAQLNAWQAGMAIQAAMPEISRAEREFILTGITPEEWAQYFGSGWEDLEMTFD